MGKQKRQEQKTCIRFRKLRGLLWQHTVNLWFFFKRIMLQIDMAIIFTFKKFSSKNAIYILKWLVNSWQPHLSYCSSELETTVSGQKKLNLNIFYLIIIMNIQLWFLMLLWILVYLELHLADYTIFHAETHVYILY